MLLPQSGQIDFKKTPSVPSPTTKKNCAVLEKKQVEEWKEYQSLYD